jgi:hypothetical protein
MEHFVLCIEHDHSEHYVTVHLSLAEAERALRAFAREVLDGPLPPESELVELLDGYAEHCRIYRCSRGFGASRASTEMEPFDHERVLVGAAP